MIEDDQRRELAQLLAAAERDGAPIEPISDAHPNLDVADAYEIQLLNIRRRVEGGSVVRGHKVGLSAKVMQRMFGVDEPDYGHLLHEMFVYEGEAVPTVELCAPRVEVEIGFVLGAPLAGPGVTAADVVRATDHIVPAIEIIDSRIRDWNIKLVDTIADNASASRVVLGANPTLLRDVDVRLIGAVLRHNGEVAETGCAAAVLGNPVTAVAWLANKVASFGVELKAGDVVLPGSCTRALDVSPGDFIRADFDTLGHVTVRFR